MPNLFLILFPLQLNFMFFAKLYITLFTSFFEQSLLAILFVLGK